MPYRPALMQRTSVAAKSLRVLALMLLVALVAPAQAWASSDQPSNAKAANSLSSGASYKVGNFVVRIGTGQF